MKNQRKMELKIRNKKGRENDNSGVGIIILAVFVGAVLILYFLSHLLYWIGVTSLIFGIVLMILGFSSNEDNLVIIGIVFLLVGVGLWLIGNMGINFFEQNPTGKNLLDSANAVVNGTRDGVKVYSPLANISG